MIHNKLMILFHLIRKTTLMVQNHIIKDKEKDNDNMLNLIKKSKSLLLNKMNNQCFNREDLTKFHSLLLLQNMT